MPETYEYTFTPWVRGGYGTFLYLGESETFNVPVTVPREELDELQLWGGSGQDGPLDLARILRGDLKGLPVAVRNGERYVDLGQFAPDGSPARINVSNWKMLKVLFQLGVCAPDGKLLVDPMRLLSEYHKPGVTTAEPDESR